jgi:hypothetical protein
MDGWRIDGWKKSDYWGAPLFHREKMELRVLDLILWFICLAPGSSKTFCLGRAAIIVARYEDLGPSCFSAVQSPELPPWAMAYDLVPNQRSGRFMSFAG